MEEARLGGTEEPGLEERVGCSGGSSEGWQEQGPRGDRRTCGIVGGREQKRFDAAAAGERAYSGSRVAEAQRPGGLTMRRNQSVCLI